MFQETYWITTEVDEVKATSKVEHEKSHGKFGSNFAIYELRISSTFTAASTCIHKHYRTHHSAYFEEDDFRNKTCSLITFLKKTHALTSSCGN